MRDLSNYFIEVEEHFQQRRGAILLLSPSDCALIESWQKAGIPLGAVLRGIDSAFDRHESSRKRGRINGLIWCAQAVINAAVDLKEASAGTFTAEVSDRDTSFEKNHVAAHLETVADKLNLATIAQEACASAAHRLRGLAARIRKSKIETVNPEILERSLTSLEEEFLVAITAAAPADLKACLKERSVRELAPYRSRMRADQLQQVERQFIQKHLLAHYNLPRFSLFYIGQPYT